MFLFRYKPKTNKKIFYFKCNLTCASAIPTRSTNKLKLKSSLWRKSKALLDLCFIQIVWPMRPRKLVGPKLLQIATKAHSSGPKYLLAFCSTRKPQKISIFLTLLNSTRIFYWGKEFLTSPISFFFMTSFWGRHDYIGSIFLYQFRRSTKNHHPDLIFF